MARQEATWPTAGRVALAFVATPVVPVLLVAGGLGLLGLVGGGGLESVLRFAGLTVLIGGVLACLATLVLGVPLYLILRMSMRLTAPIAGGLGALIGGVAWVLVVLPGAGVTYVLSPDDVIWLLIFVGSGMVGGLVFWRVHEGGRGNRVATPHPSGSA